MQNVIYICSLNSHKEILQEISNNQSSQIGMLVLIHFLKIFFAVEILVTPLRLFSTLLKNLSDVRDHVLSVNCSLATVSLDLSILLTSLAGLPWKVTFQYKTSEW